MEAMQMPLMDKILYMSLLRELDSLYLPLISTHFQIMRELIMNFKNFFKVRVP
jgi:hypothetical protein